MKEQLLKILQDVYKKQDLLLYEQYEKGELEYWDGGNSDDTFDLGVEIGAIQMLVDVIGIVEDLQEEVCSEK